MLSALSFFMISLSTNVNAEPRQISPETIKNVDGKRFWQSEVQCTNKTNLRYIEKQIDSEQWCLQLSPTVCFSNKNTAANEVCSDGYDNVILTTNQLTQAIASPPATNAVIEPFVEEEHDDDDTYFDIDALITEKAQLESELSLLQQKKVDLNRRKTELQNSILSN